MEPEDVKVLKGIPPMSPELFKMLIATGHGDELVIADGCFPSASLAIYANIILKKGLVTQVPTGKP